jgi:hypothetical protein
MANIRPYEGRGTPGPDICAVMSEKRTIDSVRYTTIGIDRVPASDEFQGRTVPNTSKDATTTDPPREARSARVERMRKRERIEVETRKTETLSAVSRHRASQFDQGPDPDP